MTKYTYTDWWEGKIYLTYCNIVYKTEDKKNLPPCVQWQDISEKDIPKIKAKQKELFNNQRNDLLKKWCDEFTKRYKSSKLQGNLLNDEIADFYDYLFNRELQGKEFVTFRNSHIRNFEANDFFEIQSYALDVIKNGREINYDFVHSPNFPFQPKGKIPSQIFAQTIWDYFQWLHTFNNKIKNPYNNLKPIKWNGTAGQLVYLFEQLLGENLLSASIDIHATIKRHFTDTDGKAFSNLKQTKQNYLNSKTGKPQKADEIDLIVSNTKERK